MTEATPKKSDLKVRAISAVVMVALAGTALWFGGLVWNLFVGAVALGVLLEWTRLVEGFSRSRISSAIWLIIGVLYVAGATLTLIHLRQPWAGAQTLVLLPILAVVATDIGAYFAGRSIGGPKIAPKISPSKTWSGLVGGAVAATMAVVVHQIGFFWYRFEFIHESPGVGVIENLRLAMSGPNTWRDILTDALMIGPITAVVAQSGDFFESWMKRRAGVKDSGSLIPGHGGLFDRLDGLLAVSAFYGIAMLPLGMWFLT